ncbi:MAG TPA: hypothetical protein VIK35_00985 [Verrucomicrobiae bacterium]
MLNRNYLHIILDQKKVKVSIETALNALEKAQAESQLGRFRPQSKRPIYPTRVRRHFVL